MQQHQFSEQTLAGIQAMGCHLEYRENTGYSTPYFLVHPDGQSFATYTDWVTVKTDWELGVLDDGSGNWQKDGTQFYVATDTHPHDYPDVADYFMYYEEQQDYSDPYNFFVLTWAIAAIIVSALLFLCVIAKGVLMDHACGWGITKEQMSACQWLVTKPNCSTATFDECANDGMGAWTSGWSGGDFDLMNIVWIGAALVGLYLAIKIIPALIPERPRSSGGGGGGSSGGFTIITQG